MIAAADERAPIDVWYFRLDYDMLLSLRKLDKRSRKLAEKTRQRANTPGV